MNNTPENKDMSMKLMFIDDDSSSHLYHNIMATDAGFDGDKLLFFLEVDEAISHLQALKENQKLDEWPNYIFVDINMPFKTGYDFVEEYQDICPTDQKSKIYFVSSTKNPADIEKVRSISIINGFRTKFLDRSYFENIKLQAQ